MGKSPHLFLQDKIGNFFEGIFNYVLFFPYLFSVTELIRTLFSPWKGLTDQSKSRGFSFSELGNKLSFNLVSIGMGVMLRTTLLGFFFVWQSIYILLIPVFILFFFLSLPLQFLMYLASETDEEVKAKAKARFMKGHLLKPENARYVEQWFETEYTEKYRKSRWWKLENLLNTTPIAKDWTSGYTPKLDSYATDLTDPAFQKNIGHMVGRAKETALIEQTLLKSEEANVVLVGEEGVGKHTIIESFAHTIYKGNCNPLLAYHRVLRLQMEKILSKVTDMKAREEFFSELLQEAVRSKNVILCIDDLDRYITSGDEAHVDLSEVLDEYASTNKLQVIGITGPYEYDKYVYPNEKMRILFTKVDVEEISKSEALQILMDTNHILEHRYKVYIPFETLQVVVEKSDFFITSIPFPEKALQLLDACCVYVNEKMKQNIILPQVVDTVLSEKVHTPTTLNTDMKQKLLQLESTLESKVINQPAAIHEVAASMRRAFLLLGKRRKPLTSFLFLGPTGVGKTETAKAITDLFFGEDKFLMRFDMSLYQTRDDIPKLIGSAETKEPGLLTDAVRRQPYGVLLLDEIEKADKNLLNVFLTILDEGYFTDGYGKRVDCKNLVIIATSNAGADFVYERMKTGAPLGSNELIAHLIEQHYYTPEFLNRFDGVIAYQPIQSNSMVPIARKMLESIQKQILELHQVKLEVSDATLQTVLERNFDPAFGARNLDRVLRNEIEDQVAQLILAGKAQPGSTIRM